jgi:hypothetical protein
MPLVYNGCAVQARGLGGAHPPAFSSSEIGWVLRGGGRISGGDWNQSGSLK